MNGGEKLYWFVVGAYVGAVVGYFGGRWLLRQAEAQRELRAKIWDLEAKTIHLEREVMGEEPAKRKRAVAAGE